MSTTDSSSEPYTPKPHAMADIRALVSDSRAHGADTRTLRLMSDTRTLRLMSDARALVSCTRANPKPCNIGLPGLGVCLSRFNNTPVIS